ncbi:CGNR zinc finger domain-containing protein [Paenibacillus antarcticus]|uniref:RNA-binding protein n=1 Tax=Paenibacillus antarcticus TaxID=253703 RepID=A0A168M087_9BACL|nr:CGNR zinc finger domain-containing protein [Paenibacillus antarcticus]OAB44071.1 RNA-binding protein [Paenibacillus antarcticus]
MNESIKFPLISGHPSLDLVNTELIRRGQRHDLLITEGDLLDWLSCMHENSLAWNKELISKTKLEIGQVLLSIRELRAILREKFEAMADGQRITESFITLLEQYIEEAPYTYKLRDQQLIAVPVGKIENTLKSLIALDVLTLISENKLYTLKRCSNPDCVLLFMDESGRRKWCSMKICGNRKKVARYEQRKMEED